LVQGAAIARDAGVPLKLELVGDAHGKKGDQETKQAIFSLITELGLQSITTHHSYLQFSQLIQLALDCHLFIAPSVTALSGDREGTPFVLQQMMATGMPVIATKHSDIPYIFGQLANLLVPERDAKAIAERIQFYYGNTQALREHGLCLRERMGSFALENTSSKLAELYDSVRRFT
jgi:colanic acid/amylovoran biosynthesis glycosyltransferase